MICIRNLCFRYKIGLFGGSGDYIFRDATVNLPNKASIALFGLPSSGKTSLLRILCGIHAPTSGSILRYGEVSFPLGFSGVSGRTIVAQYVRFIARCYGQNDSSFLKLVLSTAGMLDYANRPLSSIQSELRAHLHYVVGYLIPFDWILVENNPFVGDRECRLRQEELFINARKRSSLILSTRKPEIAIRYCDSALLIKDKRLIYYEDIYAAARQFVEMGGSKPLPAHYLPTPRL